ncbi:MAG: hypothetical protein GOV01_01150 [Candidatus Altiarchaeota archaeon]|nr:hypothetical protein [Candidatus Altiarchaeota archaeon]
MRLAPLAVMVFLIASASAYEVSVSADSSVHAFSDLSIRAYVTDSAVPVEYPSCTYEIFRGGSFEYSGSMNSEQDYAEIIRQFQIVGGYTVDVFCYDASGSQSFSVTSNSQIDMSVSPASSVGDILEIRTQYETLSGGPITTASCNAEIHVDGDFVRSVILSYNTERGEYVGWTTVTESGYHDVDTECADFDYSVGMASDGFSISQSPVTITPSSTSISGTYGSPSSLSLSVSPTTTTCTSNYGSMYKTSSSQYLLTIDFDFIGQKSVEIDCTAPNYAAKSVVIKAIGEEATTKLNVGFSTESPYSFQTFSVKPNYYDANWNPVYDASCTVKFEDETKQAKSFQDISLKAPPGPLETSVDVSCSKYGYKEFSGVAIFNIKPIDLGGQVDYSPEIKQEEPFSISVTTYPRISADCDLKGRVLSVSEVVVERVEQNNYLNGEGKFELQLGNSGNFEFTVTCSAEGYKEFEKTGEIKVNIFSQEEEVQATILLTILTAILAVGFMLIRKWL